MRRGHTRAFHPDETRHVLRTHLVDDDIAEPTERFIIKLHDVDNASIKRGQATVTITEDD